MIHPLAGDDACDRCSPEPTFDPVQMTLNQVENADKSFGCSTLWVAFWDQAPDAAPWHEDEGPVRPYDFRSDALRKTFTRREHFRL
jgi:hypothetical protein